MADSFAYPAEPGPPFSGLGPGSLRLAPWVGAVCDRLDRRDLQNLIVGRCLRVFEPGVADGHFADVLSRSVGENLDTLIAWLNGRVDLSRLRLEQPLSFAMIQAELNVPQADVQRSYRVSFLTIWEVLVQQVRQDPTAKTRPNCEVADAIDDLTRAVFTYQDFVTSQAVAQYSRVESTLKQSKVRLRQQLIREMLSDEPHPLPAADLVMLEYDLSLHHIAAVLLGRGSDGAVNLVREGRARGLFRDGLVYARGLRSTIVWFGRGTAWDHDAELMLAQMLADAADTVVLGTGHTGAGGLAASAKEAERVIVECRLDGAVSSTQASRVVRYREVMLDLLLLADRDRARDFVMEVLGPLAYDTAEAGRLRMTLEASLATGSHVAAAAELGVHEQTIRNRLARVERMWGEPVRRRRAEVEAALRLVRLLGALTGDVPAGR